MPEITTTVEIDGETREVPLDTEELGVIPREEVEKRYAPKAQVDAERRKAAREARREAREELAEDEDFLSRLVTEREDYFRERFGGEGEGDGPDLEKVREQIRREEVDPLKEELEGRGETIQRLRRKQLQGEVAQACADLPVKKNLRPLVQSFYEGRVQWSDEYGGWFLTDEDGEFQYASNPDENEAPYKTIVEDLEQKYRSGDYVGDWFSENGRPGADVGSPGSGSGRRGRVTLEQFKEMSPTERRQIKEQDYDRWRELQDERRGEGMEALTSTGSGI